MPVQIGSATNWIKVWANGIETVGMQSDGRLWYWGENPNPAHQQDAGSIRIPTRVGPDTNWVDVGFSVNSVLAIKADGTLWIRGRQAGRYTGESDPARNTFPSRVGTNSDWRSICPGSGWWCTGLVKKDGTLWFMDASEGKPNGPRKPYQPVQFRPVDVQKKYIAYAAGSVHAAAPGVHGPIGVILTADGEVWTWGMVLGDPPSCASRTEALVARVVNAFHFKMAAPDPPPIFRDKPWQLQNE